MIGWRINGDSEDAVKRSRRRLAVLVVAAGLAMGSAGVAIADPAFPPNFPPDQNQLPQLPTEPQIYDLLPIPSPDQDPWYDDPADLASYQPGQIVRSREVQTRVLGIPFPVYTEQLLFRSNDVHDNPIVTATTVVGPGMPLAGRPRPARSVTATSAS